MSVKLGQEIKRLRIAAGYSSLRGFAQALEISAAHQSDIEHGRRMPSEDLLHRMSRLLTRVGGTYEYLQSCDARIDPEVQIWAKDIPEVAAMLREVKDSGRNPSEVLEEVRRFLNYDSADAPKPSDSK